MRPPRPCRERPSPRPWLCSRRPLPQFANLDAADQLSTYTGPEGTLTYTYDNAGELTGVGGARSESYSYDLNGNRTMTGYSTTTGNRLASDGTYSYTYDNEGNELTKTRISDGQVTSFTWDYRNRLKEVTVKTSGGTTLQDDVFTYDVNTRRIGKSTLSGGQTWTAYDGAIPYADFNGSGTLTFRYLYGRAADALFARLGGANTIWYLGDKLGSVRLVVNSGGTVLDAVTYASYGTVLTETSPSNGDRFKFTARELDAEIGLQYNRARYYDPAMARWTTEDPLGFNAGDTNVFRYVVNSPIADTDPSGTVSSLMGMNSETLAFLIAAGVIGGTLYLTHKCNFLNGKAMTDAIIRDFGRIGDSFVQLAKDGFSPPRPSTRSYTSYTIKAIPTPSIPFPGDVPADQPLAPGFQWRGKPPPGSEEGNWYNPDTGESLWNDMGHMPPIGPHWDYSKKGFGRFRWFPDGRMEPK